MFLKSFTPYSAVLIAFNIPRMVSFMNSSENAFNSISMPSMFNETYFLKSELFYLSDIKITLNFNIFKNNLKFYLNYLNTLIN